jgi:hypothetical protein
MKKELTVWQRTALAHPHDIDVTDEPDPICMHVGPKDRTVMLSCDIDAARTFGGPVWHVSVWRPSRTRAEAVLSGVGEGELFEEPGIHPQILHLRRRMTIEEIKLLAGSGENQAGCQKQMPS